MSRKAANRWRPNEEVTSCAKCQTKFHVFFRRHHCRQCGDIFCAECSSKKRVVPIVHPTEPQRVCDKCRNISRMPGLNGSSPAAAVVAKHGSSLSSINSGGNNVSAGTMAANGGLGGRQHIATSGSSSATPVGGSAQTFHLNQPGRGTSPPGVHDAPYSVVVVPASIEINAGAGAGGYQQQQQYDLGGQGQGNVHQLQPQEASMEGTNLMVSGPPEFSSDDDDEYEDGMGTPPSLRPTRLSQNAQSLEGTSPNQPNGNTAGAALSFMAALEDATKMRNQLSLPVLLYVNQGHEVPIVATVESADEVVDDLIGRLTARFFELKYGMRKRPKGNDLETLQSTLQFVNEAGRTIPRDIALSDLCRRQERVLLATTDTVIHHQQQRGSTRSLNVDSEFFMRSERSENDSDNGLDICLE